MPMDLFKHAGRVRTKRYGHVRAADAEFLGFGVAALKSPEF